MRAFVARICIFQKRKEWYFMDQQNHRIGISEDRLHHIIGVARKAYQLAKEEGHNEEFCRRMFLLGFLHDIGYEFSEWGNEHPKIGAEMLTDFAQNQDRCIDAVREHGEPLNEMSDESRILNMADMLIDFTGTEVDIKTRLNNIKLRHGDSGIYKKACEIAENLGLN